MSSLLSNF